MCYDPETFWLLILIYMTPWSKFLGLQQVIGQGSRQFLGKLCFSCLNPYKIWNCITFVLWKVWPPNFSQKLISTRQEKEHIILLIMMSLQQIMASWRILQNLLRLRGIKIFKNIMKAIYSDKKWNYIQLFQHHLASYQLLFLFKFSNFLGFYCEKILTSAKFERHGAQV